MTVISDRILLSHGSGGTMMHQLINDLFFKWFDNPILNRRSDSATLPATKGKLAFTTDSFVVDPLFFPGGNIGKLAVCGTVNDLVASGAVPYCLSAAFIIEEGFPFAHLEKIVASMAEEAERAGVFIATGDTKVVEKGKCDKVFINTSGLGYIPANQDVNTEPVAGDQVIVTGFIGDHGMAVMAARNNMDEGIDFESDCASLNGLLHGIMEKPGGIRFMRDPTRGGLATTLCELAGGSGFGVVIFEGQIPVRPSVKGYCDMLGFDPLYVANEGKMILVADPVTTPEILDRLTQHPLGRNAAVIGEISQNHKGIIRLITPIGGSRIVNMLSGGQLPRIC